MKPSRFPWIMTFLCVAGITFTACDPTYNVEYQIHNNSRQQIYIYSRYRIGTSSDTNYIASGTKLSLYSEWGIGTSTEKHMESIHGLPFEIAIFNREGQPVNRDVQDFSFWSKFYTSKSKANGIVQLSLYQGDF